MFQISPVAQLASSLTQKLPESPVYVHQGLQMDYRRAFDRPLKHDIDVRPDFENPNSQYIPSLMNTYAISWKQALWTRTKAYAKIPVEFARLLYRKIAGLFQSPLNRQQQYAFLESKLQDNILYQHNKQGYLDGYGYPEQMKKIDLNHLIVKRFRHYQNNALPHQDAIKIADQLNLSQDEKDDLRENINTFVAENGLKTMPAWHLGNLVMMVKQPATMAGAQINLEKLFNVEHDDASEEPLI